MATVVYDAHSITGYSGSAPAVAQAPTRASQLGDLRIEMFHDGSGAEMIKLVDGLLSDELDLETRTQALLAEHSAQKIPKLRQQYAELYDKCAGAENQQREAYALWKTLDGRARKFSMEDIAAAKLKIENAKAAKPGREFAPFSDIRQWKNQVSAAEGELELARKEQQKIIKSVDEANRSAQGALGFLNELREQLKIIKRELAALGIEME